MKSTIIIIAIFLFSGVVTWSDVFADPGKKHKNKKLKEDLSDAIVSGYDKPVPSAHIIEKWELPVELREISGVAYISENIFACVQDEEGVVYIYDKSKAEITKRIAFSVAGDFEGITVKDNTAYVVRADGRLYEVDLNAIKPVKEYATSLTVEQNIEGLCYDQKKNRLLLAIKYDEPNANDYKGIYAFDLTKKKFIAEPVFKIDLTNQLLRTGRKTVMPSAIAINPNTSEMYITDGPSSRLLILDKNGSIKKFLSLGKEFAQPEGITFNTKGEMFISNEGKKAGNIMKVELL